METAKRRQILEALAGDERSSTADRLRALELLAKLDGEPEADPDWALFKELQAMSEEELEALGAPLTTGRSYEDDEHFEAEVEKRAELRMIEATAELRQEAHRLRTALAEAETRLESSAPTASAEAPRSAPSATGTVSERPLRIVPPEGIDLEAGWSKRSDGPVLTSFERKARGLPEA